MLIFLGVILALLGLLALLGVIGLGTTTAVILLVIGAALVALHYTGWARR